MLYRIERRVGDGGVRVSIGLQGIELQLVRRRVVCVGNAVDREGRPEQERPREKIIKAATAIRSTGNFGTRHAGTYS